MDSIVPKRALVAVAGTGLALALLFSFKTPDDPGPGGANGSTRGAVAAPTSRAATPTQAAGGSTATPQSTDGPAATPTPTSGTLADGTVAGPVVDTRFGPVQVQVTVSGGKVTEITALQLPSGGRSGRISEVAEPILHDEALSAQSAQIDTVSGATYTSDAYERSLQAALDQAGI
jgi:uncharacterized protein with FMN-binding domain